METDTTGLRERLQATLGNAYTLERELGGGGMSRVFVALDARLGRRVVVKVLDPSLAAGLSARRFEREVTLAARLQHPHVVPLLSAGEVDGLPYYTMPYVQGESLRQRLAREGALPIGDAVRLVRELADALAYAHGEGVVHRDLKPENVLLSGGHAVVADFGVAKALASATAGGTAPGGPATVTGLGLAVGTPAYMAPEQAAADPATDHRADLYALGLIAYELLAGAHPFAGRTPQAMLAAHMTETPAPLAERRPEVPRALAALVMRLLAKDPAARPPSAAAVLAAVDAVGAAAPRAEPARRAARRGPRWWGGVAAAALLAAVGVVAAARARSAAGVHDEGPPDGLVVADFENQAGDSTLTRAVAQALRIDLARSPRLALPSARQVRQGLAAMRADTAGALTAELALELARRSRGKAALDGAVGRAGAGFVLTARLTAVADGSTVATFRETAADSSGVIGAIDRLSRAVRAEVGESVGSLRASPRFYLATTPSLPALTAYTRVVEASDANDWLAVIEHAREAVALDPEFAEAHRRIGIALGNLGIRRTERVQALTRAYAARGRLHPYEQGMVEASYYSNVLGDDRRAAERYRALLTEFPNPRSSARNNLYATYARLGAWELAGRTVRVLADSAPYSQLFRLNHVESLIGLGQLDSAAVAVRKMARDFPGQPSAARAGRWLAFARRDYLGALAAADSALGTSPRLSTTGRLEVLAEQRTAAAVLGRLGARARAEAQLAREYRQLGAAPELLKIVAEQAELEAALGLRERAVRRLDSALADDPLTAMPPLDRPYAALAAAWAAAGRPDRAEALLAAWARAVPAENQPLEAVALLRARILTSLAAGRPAEAERLSRDGAFGACGGCADLYLARTFDAQGRADSTVAAYERYLGATAGRDLLDPTELARAYRQLGELYEARGDVPRAIQRYGDFVALWAGAEAALQPAVVDAREQIRRLQARAG